MPWRNCKCECADEIRVTIEDLQATVDGLLVRLENLRAEGEAAVAAWENKFVELRLAVDVAAAVVAEVNPSAPLLALTERPKGSPKKGSTEVA